MSKDGLKNVGASVRQRLLNVSRERNTDFGVILSNYALERFLYRLGLSEHKDRFVLKGAMLFRIWSDEPHRATRDLDLLAFGSPSGEEIGLLFRDICDVNVENDGVEFRTDGLRTEDIREGQQYHGVRVRFNAVIAGARIPLQIDVGFGDSVTPAAEDQPYPTILDFPTPQVNTYSKESLIAEKFHAMVALGIANSRMKDFYDIYSLATTCEFGGASVSAAIKATFGRRSTPLPSGVPTGLSPEFSQDRMKLTQWRAFVSGGNVRHSSLELEHVVDVLSRFLLPPAHAAAENRPLGARWLPPGPWTEL